jgi:hypothetical protein
MSPSSPCAYKVPLPGQCDPVLHTVDGLVIVGEETMDVTQFSVCLCFCIFQLVGNHQSLLKAHLQK